MDAPKTSFGSNHHNDDAGGRRIAPSEKDEWINGNSHECAMVDNADLVRRTSSLPASQILRLTDISGEFSDEGDGASEGEEEKNAPRPLNAAPLGKTGSASHSVQRPNHGSNTTSSSLQQQPGAFLMPNSGRCQSNRGWRQTPSERTQAAESNGPEQSDEQNAEQTPTLEAELVSEATTHEAEVLRKRLEEIEQAPEATVVSPGTVESDTVKLGQSSRPISAVCALLVVILAVVVVVFVVVLPASQGDNSPDSQSLTPPEGGGDAAGAGSSNSSTVSDFDTTILSKPTLQAIQERGYIRCRIESFEREQGHGLSIDLCRALSAAIFGDPDRTEYPVSPWREQWMGLHDGSLDVSTSQATFNMGRDVYEEDSHKSHFFSTHWMISGVGFAGLPEFVDCAERRDTLTGICLDLSICAIEASTGNGFLHAHFEGAARVHLAESSVKLVESFMDGTCNVFVGEATLIYEQRVRDAGYMGPFAEGLGRYSNEPLALVSRGDDPEWADFTNAVLQALITAEAQRITKGNATLFPQTDMFGEGFENMFRNTIAAVGNWGEMFDRAFAQKTTRDIVNMLTGREEKERGLLFAPPFGILDVRPGFISDVVPGRVANGVLEAIDKLGHLRCGVIGDRPGFALLDTNGDMNPSSPLYAGFDTDLCRALSSALFGTADLVVFVPLADASAGFNALVNGEIDVFAGAPYSLKNDVKEETTGDAFTFSSIYYYGLGGENLAMATAQDDPQWGDFVRWVIYSLVYAEKHDLGSEDASEMPYVNLFGPSYRLMFRLALLNVGNYGDLYQRNIEALIPRSGHNLLNDGTAPLLYPLPIDMFE